MYAIVDIETTGGYAARNGIIEIAVKVFDGESIIEQFETLINPGLNFLNNNTLKSLTIKNLEQKMILV